MRTPVHLLEAWELLTDRERLVVEDYLDGLAFEAIGAQFSVSRQRAQQVLVRAFKKLGLSEEQRRNLSAGHRSTLNAALSERCRSPEMLARLKTTLHKEPLSAAAREKIAAANRGQKRSAETRERIRLAHLGTKRAPFSPEWRARLSAAQKARRARIKAEAEAEGESET
jgi:predicted DNA-binding protein YlxM (UPF0122 family)